MLRRDLLATLLSLLPGVAVESAVDEIATAVAGSDGDPGTEPRTAIVDRIEHGTAVVQFEDGSGTRSVPAAVLPTDAREEGIVLRVPRGDSLALATVDRAATAERRRKLGSRFDDLAEPAPDPGTASNDTATDGVSP